MSQVAPEVAGPLQAEVEAGVAVAGRSPAAALLDSFQTGQAGLRGPRVPRRARAACLDGASHLEVHRPPRSKRALPAPDDRIITDSVDPDRHENPAFRTYRLGEKGEIKSSAQRYRVRWQRYATPWFRYLMLAPAEMERLVVGTGWRVARIIDDGSPRYAAVLEKQG